MMARFLSSGVFLLLFMAGCDDSAPPTVEERWMVAWSQGFDLRVWSPGAEARTIATGNIAQVFLAPDGQHIAFTRETDQEEDTLGVVGSDGTGEQRIGTPVYLHQLAWGNESTLVFNTFGLDATGGMPRNDLYLVDIHTGAVTSVEPGGHFSVSPDGAHIVVSDPGIYQTEPGEIRALATSGDLSQTTLFEFPAVSSGASYPFYLPVYWENNSTIRVAIPAADAVYHEFSADQAAVELWRVALDGTSEPIGSAASSYFGLPQWSADTSALIYLQRQADPNLFTLWTADANGGNPTVYYAQESLGEVPQAFWLGDRRVFLYIHDNAYWLGTPGESPRRWLEGGEMLLTTTHKVAESTMVFIVVGTDTLELRYADLDDPEGESTLIASGTDRLYFDVIALPTGNLN